MPPAHVRPSAARWLRANLFGTPWNTAITLILIAAALFLLPGLVRWAVLDAVWGGAPGECRAANGACWAVIGEKYRLILFGRYPFAEQWRPLCAMALMIGLVATSCHPRMWRRVLAPIWLAGLVLMGALMWGGFAGLTLVEARLWGGLPLTLMLAVAGAGFAFPLAILLALGRRSSLPAVRWVCIGYIELIRGVPLISLLFMGAFLLPLFLPGEVRLSAVARAQIAIVLFAAAYLAEVVRGGLQAVPRGQYEAAKALGLSYWQTTGRVILPQALRVSIPPIVNTFIGLFKDTSLVAIVGLTDLLLATRQAIADPAWRAQFIEAYIAVAAIYFVFCFSLSRYSVWLERTFAARRA